MAGIGGFEEDDPFADLEHIYQLCGIPYEDDADIDVTDYEAKEYRIEDCTDTAALSRSAIKGKRKRESEPVPDVEDSAKRVRIDEQKNTVMPIPSRHTQPHGFVFHEHNDDDLSFLNFFDESNDIENTASNDSDGLDEKQSDEVFLAKLMSEDNEGDDDDNDDSVVPVTKPSPSTEQKTPYTNPNQPTDTSHNSGSAVASLLASKLKKPVVESDDDDSDDSGGLFSFADKPKSEIPQKELPRPEPAPKPEWKPRSFEDTFKAKSVADDAPQTSGLGGALDFSALNQQFEAKQASKDSSDWWSDRKEFKTPSSSESFVVKKSNIGNKDDPKKAEGNEHLKKGRYTEAIACYTEALENITGGVEEEEAVKIIPRGDAAAVLFSNRSCALLHLGHHKKAFTDAANCVVARPGWFKGYLRKALVLSDIGAHDAADGYFVEALKYCTSQDAQNRASVTAQRETAKKSQKNTSGGTFYDAFIKESSEGTAAYRSKSWGESVRRFSQALRIDRSNIVVLANRSAALANLNQNEQALKDADECIHLDPLYAKGYVRKAAALVGLFRKHEAKTLLNDAIQKLQNVSVDASSLELKLKELR